jgi:hypothetical protein
MTREQILQAYLEDESLTEKKYLIEGENTNIKWSAFREIKMVDVIKFAIEGVINGDSQTALTRKINQFLDKG